MERSLWFALVLLGFVVIGGASLVSYLGPWIRFVAGVAALVFFAVSIMLADTLKG